MLDPTDWTQFRASAHHALDRALDALNAVPDGPVWREPSNEAIERVQTPMPQDPSTFDAVVEAFVRDVLPYPVGNQHPRFFGWVNGSATPSAAVAELLAALMNANVGGRNHMAVYVERQVLRWFADLFGFPDTSSGVMTVGTSSATLIAAICARTRALGAQARERGIQRIDRPLVGYASRTAHACVRKAFEVAGLGAESLRAIEVDASQRIDTRALADGVAEDRAKGFQPFMLVGNAGSVDTGAIDPLDKLGAFAQREGLWFHVDGAFGALSMLAPALRPALKGIEGADSLAFDFHKWLHVPYDAGCVLIRDGMLHRHTFTAEDAYFTHAERGLAGASPWFADLGIDLSRGFRALKVWFALHEHGAKRLGASIERNVRQAQRLAELVDADPLLERRAHVALNIVCFRYLAPGIAGAELNRFTERLAAAVQDSGRAVLSTTTVDGVRVLRVCITNHRTRDEDLEILLDAVRSAAGALLAELPA